MLLVACAVPRAGIMMPDGSTVYTLYPRLEYVDAQRQSMPSVRHTGDIIVIFGIIPGQIYGATRDAPFKVFRAPVNSPFPLDLGEMTTYLHRKSKTLRDDTYAKGLIVTPPDTRFARLATLAMDDATKKGVPGSGFLDGASRDGLVLIYVDRACTITGTQELMGEHHHYDVTLRDPGFHWIHIAGSGTKSLHLTDFDEVKGIIYALSQTP
jgi:hypothetical protein